MFSAIIGWFKGLFGGRQEVAPEVTSEYIPEPTPTPAPIPEPVKEPVKVSAPVPAPTPKKRGRPKKNNSSDQQTVTREDHYVDDGPDALDLLNTAMIIDSLNPDPGYSIDTGSRSASFDSPSDYGSSYSNSDSYSGGSSSSSWGSDSSSSSSSYDSGSSSSYDSGSSSSGGGDW